MLITKAFLLAAGLGTRLRPLTDTIPKCLIQICDKPILAWWIDLMENYGIEEVLINTHHLNQMVNKFLLGYPTKIKFHIYYEKKLLGSAGTIRENRDFIGNDSHFFIFYADNLTNYNLASFSQFHLDGDQILSMALFETNNPTQCGIVEQDKNGIIINFEEKPKHPKSNLANAGLYLAKPDILEVIPNLELTDIGYHLLPELIGKMDGWLSKDFLIDIGTKKKLEEANCLWPKINNRKNL